MPTFEIQGDDGKTYEADAPDMQSAAAAFKKYQESPLAAPAAAPPDTSGVAPQALSGVNEGLANFLSLPNSLELGARSIGPRLLNLFGGHAAIPDKTLLPDAGAAYRGLADSMDAIKPPTEAPAGKFARRVGEEVGANLIPGLGGPAKVARVVSALASGTGAATAQMFAPDNPAAEMAGELGLGSLSLVVSNALGRGAAKLAAPSVDALKTQARGLYDAAEQRGVMFPQPAVKQTADEIAARAMSDGIDPTLHPGATAALKRMQAAGATGMTIRDAQTMRRVLSAAAKDPMNPDQARIAGGMIDTFDNFVGGAAPELAQARAVYSRAKKAETIQGLFVKARDAAGANYTAAGLETALRQQFRSLLDSPRRLRGFTDDEIAAIRTVVRGGPVDNALRALGKLAPTGVVSLGVSSGVPFAIGNALLGPGAGAAAAGATMGAGMVAKAGASALTMRNARIAEALAARGGNASVPLIMPETTSAAEALLAGQAANQNAPRSSVVDALRPPIRANGR